MSLRKQTSILIPLCDVVGFSQRRRQAASTTDRRAKAVRIGTAAGPQPRSAGRDSTTSIIHYAGVDFSGFQVRDTRSGCSSRRPAPFAPSTGDGASATVPSPGRKLAPTRPGRRRPPQTARDAFKEMAGFPRRSGTGTPSARRPASTINCQCPSSGHREACTVIEPEMPAPAMPNVGPDGAATPGTPKAWPATVVPRRRDRTGEDTRRRKVIEGKEPIVRQQGRKTKRGPKRIASNPVSILVEPRGVEPLTS